MATIVNVLDPAIWRVWFAGQAYLSGVRLTAKKWAEQEQADLAWNLTTFGWATGNADTYVKAQGRDISYGHEDHSVLIMIDAYNQCRGYSNGIINGKVNINRPMKGRAATRNGVGITDRGHIIIAQSSDKISEKLFCQRVNGEVLKRCQTVKAFVLEDGGGSTQEHSTRSKLTFAPECKPDNIRTVPNVICAKLRAIPTLTRPIYNGAPKGDEVGLWQTLLGGIVIDNDPGPTTANRTKASQIALGFPGALRCGVASAYTFKAFGLKSSI